MRYHDHKKGEAANTFLTDTNGEQNFRNIIQNLMDHVKKKKIDFHKEINKRNIYKKV